jgi:hypothetical protein
MKETAIEIGKTCNLILPENQIDCIDLASSSEDDDTIETFKEKIQKIYSFYMNVLYFLYR